MSRWQENLAATYALGQEKRREDRRNDGAVVTHVGSASPPPPPSASARTTPQVVLLPVEAAEGGREGRRLSYDLFPAAPVAARSSERESETGESRRRGRQDERGKDGRTGEQQFDGERAIQRHFSHPRWRLSSRGKSPLPMIPTWLRNYRSRNQPTVRPTVWSFPSSRFPLPTVGSRKKVCSM